MDEALERAKAAAGGPSGLARGIGGITSQAVSQWERVPVARVKAISALTGIPPHELRPDIFPAPAHPAEAEAAS